MAQRKSKRWDRIAHRFPYKADVPVDAVPSIARALRPCIVLDLSDDKTQRWRFKKRSHRDEFVQAFRPVGARSYKI